MKFDIKQLKTGLKNYYIYQLQRLIKKIEGLIIDDPVGEFGESTVKAIKKLQKDNRLKQTGKVSLATLRVIEKLWEDSGLEDDLNFVFKGKILDKNTLNPLIGLHVEI